MSDRSVLFIITCILLTSCVTSIEQLRKANFKGTSFQTELAKQYLDFAESEADQYDWFNSAYFARKGLKAVSGETPLPEDLNKWSLPADVLPTLTQARGYLVTALTPEAIAKFPAKAAKTQFLFDCWIEQQEEGWQANDIAYCREGFYNSLDKLFSDDTNIDTSAVIPPTQANETIQPSQEIKLAYFKTGSDQLNDSAKRTISNVISRLKDIKDYNITLNGYSDSVGTDAMNMKLSKNRATTIKKALLDGGLNSSSITIFAFGKEGRVKKADNTPWQENRTVEIVVDIK